eukprot:m51a1_g4549 putative polygalacturonase inhibitor 1 (351) ;mRNA; r:68087-69859
MVPTVSVLLAVVLAVRASLPSSERDALVAFYEATGGSASWTRQDGWPRSSQDSGVGDPCSWDGVTCSAPTCSSDPFHHVTGIYLARNGLAGTVTPLLEALPRLSALDLGGNKLSGQITGTIPSEFGSVPKEFATQAPSLQVLHLNDNALEGFLPEEYRTSPAQGDKVGVVVLASSKCPDTANLEGLFIPLLRDLGSIMHTRLGWIARRHPQYPMGFWSLHGQTEMIGNAITSCAERRHGLLRAFELATCMNKNISNIPANLGGCARRLQMNATALRACALGPEGASLLSQGVQLAEENEAVWSPTVRINGRHLCLWNSVPCFAADYVGFGRVICAEFRGRAPSACKKYLE